MLVALLLLLFALRNSTHSLWAEEKGEMRLVHRGRDLGAVCSSEGLTCAEGSAVRGCGKIVGGDDGVRGDDLEKVGRRSSG